jgi:hypothetical protein
MAKTQTAVRRSRDTDKDRKAVEHISKDAVRRAQDINKRIDAAVEDHKQTAALMKVAEQFEKFGVGLVWSGMPEVRFIDGKYCIDGGGEIETGRELVVDMRSLRHGFVRREYGHTVKSLMGYVSDGFKPPARESLGDLDEEQWPVDDDDRPQDPWRYTISIQMYGHNEDGYYLLVFDDELECEESIHPATDIGLLARLFAAQLRAGHDNDPVLELGRYLAYGTRYWPKISFVGWDTTLLSR